jgi:hypothetical protein
MLLCEMPQMWFTDGKKMNQLSDGGRLQWAKWIRRVLIELHK